MIEGDYTDQINCARVTRDAESGKPLNLVLKVTRERMLALKTEDESEREKCSQH